MQWEAGQAGDREGAKGRPWRTGHLSTPGSHWEEGCPVPRPQGGKGGWKGRVAAASPHLRGPGRWTKWGSARPTKAPEQMASGLRMAVLSTNLEGSSWNYLKVFRRLWSLRGKEKAEPIL